MDFIVAQLALIFLPGLIWANLDNKYVVGVRPSHIQSVLKPFSFGLATYALLYLLYGFFGKSFSLESFSNAPEKIDFFQFSDEIIWSIPLSIVLAILWMYFQNYKIFMHLLHRIKATKRYGDQDVWTYTFNSGQPHVEYVNVRNVETGFTYSGWVNSFSEREEFRELLLEDVLIIGPDGERTKSPHLYISMQKTNIWLEFPYTENKDYYDVEPENS